MGNNHSNNNLPVLLHQIFEEQAAKTPQRVAIEHIEHESRVTYKELNQLANRLAALLSTAV